MGAGPIRRRAVGAGAEPAETAGQKIRPAAGRRGRRQTRPDHRARQTRPDRQILLWAYSFASMQSICKISGSEPKPVLLLLYRTARPKM